LITWAQSCSIHQLVAGLAAVRLSNLKSAGQYALGDAPAVDSNYSGATRASGTALSHPDIAEQLRLIALGNQAALGALYAATSAKLFGVISRILGTRDLAEDVLQEVYIRIWQRAGEFDPAHGSPTAWLVTIARTYALDESRRTTTARKDDCPPLSDASNEDHVADHEEGERLLLLASLDKLAPEMKEAVVLAYHYGMSREEIARRTNRPVATVQAWLRQGLAQVKDGLGR
jgi:RNA polymerase sigma-70 factor, ECF subfamily